MKSLPDGVSVILRSFNEAWAVKETLEGVFGQDFQGVIELIAIDSGSTDASIDIIKSFKPALLREILQEDYVPGRVLNWGMQQCSYDWVFCLNADATPVGKNWLTALLQAGLSSANPGAFYSRQIPRPRCLPVYAHDYERCYGPQRESVNWPNFFSMVSALAYKPAWRAYPIREDIQYAEDNDWAKRLRQAGYEVAFVENSVVMHSHNYSLTQSFKRAMGDSKAMTYSAGAEARKDSFLGSVVQGAVSDLVKDAQFFAKHGMLGGLPSAVGVRIAQRLGRWQGNREGLHDFKNVRDPGSHN